LTYSQNGSHRARAISLAAFLANRIDDFEKNVRDRIEKGMDNLLPLISKFILALLDSDEGVRKG